MNPVLQRTMMAAVASLGLGLLFDHLFYDKMPGVSFPLYVALVVAGALATLRFYRIKLSFQATLLLLPLAFFSLMVFVRAGSFVTFLNVIASLYVGGLLLYAVFMPRIRTYIASQYGAPLSELPRALLGGFKSSVGDVSATTGLFKKHPALPRVFRGIVITIPVLVLLGVLLSSADLVFRKYLTDVFSINLDDDFVARALLVSAVTAVCFGIFGYLTHNHKHTNKEEAQGRVSALKRLFGERGGIEVTILLASVGVLFLSFLLIQLAYLFGGVQNITEQGFTYAQYARKGFFELIFVAVITYIVIAASERAMLRGRERHNTLFKALSGILILEVLVMMASALKRLALYESAYGFTTLRVLSHIFTMWLVLVFAVLLYKILKNHQENTFAFLNFVSVMTLLVFINLFNIDAFVARKNIERYHDTGKLDVSYLGDLSDDAVPEVVRLLDKPGDHRQDLEYILADKRDNLREVDDWQSANLSRSAALKAIESKLDT